MTGGFGADFTFEAPGNVGVMHQAVEAARMGLVPVLVDRYLAGEIDLEPFVSHRIGLDEVNRGFELMEAQDGIRSVIEFSS